MIDPQLPYIYLPDADFKTFQVEMETKYPEIDCSSTLNRCKFEKSCSEVKAADDSDPKFYFVDVDANKAY
jgi:hypothetical protein